MKSDACLPDKSQIAREILAYLREHPDAQDTLDGILKGWLVDGGNRYNRTVMQEVIKDLVLEGTIQESKTTGSNAIYRLNLGKRNRLKELSKRKD